MIVTHESNSGHWYAKDGKPFYTIIGANGKERATRVTDARKLGLLPSVTTIIGGILAKPALERWKQEQVLLASLTLPRQENEPEADWLKRVIEDSRSTGKDAMERGTNMHNILELYFNQTYMPEYPAYTIRTEQRLREHFGDQFWITEKSFAHNELGYAGKVDLHSFDDNGIVVDFKTKLDLKNPDIYTDHILQIVAYMYGLNLPLARGAICFVSEDETIIKEISQEDLQKGWKMFQCLLVFFRLKNGLELAE
jgi:hypothetical protein